MTRHRKQKPHDPAEAQRLALARDERAADRERLGTQEGVHLNPERPSTSPTDMNPIAERRDVFAQLFHALKPAIGHDEYNAVRRFETDLATSLGAGDRGSGTGRVDCGLAVPAALRILMAASDRVKAVQDIIGKRDFNLLLALIKPPLHGRLVVWRTVVAEHTGEAQDRAQTVAVRQCCKALAAAYVDLDYRSKAA